MGILADGKSPRIVADGKSPRIRGTWDAPRRYRVFVLAADGDVLRTGRFTTLPAAQAMAHAAVLTAGQRVVMNETGADLIVRQVYERTG